MAQESLIFTLSGIRGIFGKQMNFEFAKTLAIAFGLWLDHTDKRVIIGRDTRPSGEVLEKAILEGLAATDYEVINTSVSPTPLIIHAKNIHNIPAGIIITGSHNSEEWNGLKLLGKHNYLQNDEITQIRQIISSVNPKKYTVSNFKLKQKISSLNPLSEYLNSLNRLINFDEIHQENNLRVVIDTGAGAGKLATPYILKSLGCEVKTINNELLVKNKFPRRIEPIPANLTDLIMEVWQGKCDIGFAHDSDADRLAIVGDDGTCYSEDTSLALIMQYLLQNKDYDSEVTFVTNIASSLMFEVIADKFNAKLIRTPIGELYLVNTINQILKDSKESLTKSLTFGGEGSCGGVIFPIFNNTRDGIFASVKIIEILVKTGEKISKLVSKLPKYYSHRENVNIKGLNIQTLITKVKADLVAEGEEVNQIGNDIRFGKDKEWFILIHPSNTEPILRVISEAKSDSLSRLYCETTTELIKLIINSD